MSEEIKLNRSTRTLNEFPRELAAQGYRPLKSGLKKEVETHIVTLAANKEFFIYRNPTVEDAKYELWVKFAL